MPYAELRHQVMAQFNQIEELLRLGDLTRASANIHELDDTICAELYAADCFEPLPEPNFQLTCPTEPYSHTEAALVFTTMAQHTYMLMVNRYLANAHTLRPYVFKNTIHRYLRLAAFALGTPIIER